MSQRKLTSPEFETCRARLRSREFKQRRGPGGRRLCFWCEAEVTEPKRQTWCSKDCVNNYLLFFGPALRRIVRERDHGVCQICHIDTLVLEQRIKAAVWNCSTEQMNQIRDDVKPELWKKLQLVKNGSRRTLWDVDHIKPLSLGGQHTLDNLRTLCLACHQKETNNLAKQKK